MDRLSIRRFAAKKASLAENELRIAHGHLHTCRCEVCIKFHVFVNIKEVIEEWEQYETASSSTG